MIPEITIVCVAYRRPAQIQVLIHCFLCQTLDNWCLHILHDGPDSEMSELLEQYALAHPRITYEFTAKRHNDHGHTLRDIGIRHVQTEYLLLTNDDNYYVPVFLQRMFRQIHEKDLDLLLCDMVHSDLAMVDGTLKFEKGGQYAFFSTWPARNRVDIGCFIVRSALARSVGFRDRSFKGDATFVEDLIAHHGESLRIGKLNEVLFVHN